MGILIIMVIIIIKNNTSILIIKKPFQTLLDYSISLGAQTVVAIDLPVSALGKKMQFFLHFPSVASLSFWCNQESSHLQPAGCGGKAHLFNTFAFVSSCLRFSFLVWHSIFSTTSFETPCLRSRLLFASWWSWPARMQKVSCYLDRLTKVESAKR